MARKQTTPAKPAAPAQAPNAMQAMATVLPTLAAQPAPAKTVALRGGQAIATVKLSGTPYRVAAPHNQVWWAALCAQLAAGPQPVAPLLQTPANPQGVPAAFVGYMVRRGYLLAV